MVAKTVVWKAAWWAARLAADLAVHWADRMVD